MKEKQTIEKILETFDEKYLNEQFGNERTVRIYNLLKDELKEDIIKALHSYAKQEREELLKQLIIDLDNDAGAITRVPANKWNDGWFACLAKVKAQINQTPPNKLIN